MFKVNRKDKIYKQVQNSGSQSFGLLAGAEAFHAN